MAPSSERSNTRPLTTSGSKHCAFSPSTSSQTFPSLQPSPVAVLHSAFFSGGGSSSPHPVARNAKSEKLLNAIIRVIACEWKRPLCLYQTLLKPWRPGRFPRQVPSGLTGRKRISLLGVRALRRAEPERRSFARGLQHLTSGNAFEPANRPTEIGDGLKDALREHENRHGEERSERSPHEAPKQHAEQDDERRKPERLPEELRLEQVADDGVDDEVSGADGDGGGGSVVGKCHEHGRKHGDRGADVGDEMQDEEQEREEERELDTKRMEHQEDRERRDRA